MFRIVVCFLPAVLFASSWAEKTLEEMTLDEKIGQLFMAPACPLRSSDHWDDWLKLLNDCHIGNAILKHSDPVSQVEFLGRLQNESKIPILVAGDTEYGLAMRMSNTIAFPRNMTLGAVSDLNLIFEMGKEIGRQSQLVGIHLDLAPVADVNNNPSNPIIHTRSFGENPYEVAMRVSAYFRGIESAGILACAKHFPGHGDTCADSHIDLPLIPFSLERLEAVELVPFKQAIEEGISALMSAHLLVPCIDPVFPASLSSRCLQILAREQLGFKGLLISDALNMKAIADRFSPEETVLLAVEAGCDILLYGAHIDEKVDELLREQIPRAFRALKEAYEVGHLDQRLLDESVMRILQAKERLGLNLSTRLSTENLLEDLHPAEADLLKKRLFQEAVTLLGEPIDLRGNIAYLSIGEGDEIGPINGFYISPKIDWSASRLLLKQLNEFDQVVVALHQADWRAKNLGLSIYLLDLIDSIADKSIFCHFATPYALKRFLNQKTILVGYENDPDAQGAVLQVLNGNEAPRGSLPVTISQ